MINKKDKKQLKEIIGNCIDNGLSMCMSIVIGVGFAHAIGLKKDRTDGEKEVGGACISITLPDAIASAGKVGGLHPRISPDSKSHYGCKETIIEKDTFFIQEGLPE